MKPWRRVQLLSVAVGIGIGVPALGQTSGPSSNSRLISGVFAEVYQIKIATDAVAPKAAYGSCFVIDVNGLLATNYHVVAFALHEPDKYNLYLVDGDHPLPADVVAFDAVNDLAILKVNKVFPKAVKFATALPETGDKIYSMGWPEDLNKSVIEGNYNGLMTAGPYRKLQMSIPLNPGMSGGPTINEYGEVIGVNVSLRLEAQSLAFAVPRESLRALLKKPPISYLHADDRAVFDEEVRTQLDHVQEQLTTQLLRGPSATISFSGWQARKPAALVKCWREEESGPRDQTTITSEHCYLPGSASVRSDVDTATFHIKYQVINNQRANSYQFIHRINETTAAFGFSFADYALNFLTKLKCNEIDVLNSQKVPLRVHYCLNSYIRYAGIYNLEFEAMTLGDRSKVLLSAGSLLGFSAHNALEIVRIILNSIRPEAA